MTCVVSGVGTEHCSQRGVCEHHSEGEHGGADERQAEGETKLK